MYVLKRHFTDDGEDIVDLKIMLHVHLEDVSINNIAVRGATCYTYELNPRPSIISLKGLAIIEVILFNIEKFLKENTRRNKL